MSSSRVHEAGRTGVEVRIRAFREAPRTGDREQTTDAYFTFVAIGESGSLAAVPELTVADGRCGRLRRGALEDAPAE